MPSTDYDAALAALQADAEPSGFHRDLRMWVDDASSVARALRHLGSRPIPPDGGESPNDDIHRKSPNDDTSVFPPRRDALADRAFIENDTHGVTIQGNANGPACATCGRKIKQAQRVRRNAEGRKVHAYAADCSRPIPPGADHD